MASKHPGSGNYTRDLIKKNFCELYRDQPLETIQVKRLIEMCNIARGTFYVYFDSIESLYKACQNELIHDMEQDLTETMLWALGQKNTPEPGYINAYAKCISKYAEKLDIYNAMLNGNKNDTFRRAWIDSVHDKFMETLRFSESYDETQKNYMAHFFAGGLVTILSLWLRSGAKETPEEIAAVTDRMLFHGALMTV